MMGIVYDKLLRMKSVKGKTNAEVKSTEISEVRAGAKGYKEENVLNTETETRIN